jgi:hypothetical protein
VKDSAGLSGSISKLTRGASSALRVLGENSVVLQMGIPKSYIKLFLVFYIAAQSPYRCLTRAGFVEYLNVKPANSTT